MEAEIVEATDLVVEKLEEKWIKARKQNLALTIL